MIMKPMGINSTLLISYQDINIDKTDLYEDAWGFNSQFCDVISLLQMVKAVPGKRITRRLIRKIRQEN